MHPKQHCLNINFGSEQLTSNKPSTQHRKVGYLQYQLVGDPDSTAIAAWNACGIFAWIATSCRHLIAYSRADSDASLSLITTVIGQITKRAAVVKLVPALSKNSNELGAVSCRCHSKGCDVEIFAVFEYLRHALLPGSSNECGYAPDYLFQE